jgi:carboxypeptidase Q
MGIHSLFWIGLTSFFLPVSQAADYTASTRQLVAEVTGHHQPYFNLTLLDAIGPRVSGSAQAELAVQWAKKKMESYGFDRVNLDPVQVPKWSRGPVEKAVLDSSTGAPQELKVAALGGSVGTPPAGIEAGVVEVHSLAEVAKLGRSGIQGKIVFYNEAMDPGLKDPFEAYGKLVSLRTAGASVAAQYGAVASVLRSLSTLPDDDHPHTGVMRYKSDVKIPSAALSTHAANILSNELRKNPSLRLKLTLSASDTTLVASSNVVGEITGSELPNEVIIVGGHLDSWDLGRGDQDDGAGVVQSLEVVRALKALKMKPKRTIRVVLFMSEEFGGIGADQYAQKLLRSGQKVVAAMESDRGGFHPVGFSVHANASAMAKIQSFKPYLKLAHADQIFPSESCGTDTETLGAAGVPEMEFIPESAHYFDLHHSALDQLSAVVPDDLNLGAAAMTVLSYLIAQEGLN